MSVLSECVLKSNLANRVFNESQLRDLLGGSDARRYALVNRALKDNSVIKIKRGQYILNPKIYSQNIHPFAIAQAMVHGSYISFETALAYYGWIPEAVYTIASVTPERKTIVYNNDKIGHFTFQPLAINQFQFLQGVERVRLNNLTAFVAQPLRALMDLVALRKITWRDLGWVINGLRVDESHLLSLGKKDFAKLKSIYMHKAANNFLQELEKSVLALKANAKNGNRYD